jgi:hypothetical protein
VLGSANGKLRSLGISTLRDWVCVTAAMLMVADHQDWKSNSELFGWNYCFPAVPGLFPPNFEDPVPLKVVGPPAVPFGLFDPAEWCMRWWRL